MKIYNGLANNRKEIEIVKRVRPDNLMLSYFYWRRKSIKDIKVMLGYNPNILLDSGAYSAYNKKLKINIDDYISYIKANEKELDGYFNLDVIGDAKESFENFIYMKSFDLNPIPVVHFRNGKNTGHLIERYLKYKPKIIGLGGTKSYKYKTIVSWLDTLKILYPKQKFHLLAKTSTEILTSGIYSCDSNSWLLAAVMGRPEFIDDKIKRAEFNLRFNNYLGRMSEYL